MKFLGLKKNWKQWLSLLCLCIGGGTIYKLPYIRDVFYVQFQETFGATNTQMGLMMTVYAITCAVSFLPGGWLTDLLPAKYLVSLGLFTTGATGLLLVSIPSMGVVLVAQAIFGVTTTLLFWEAMFKGVRILGSPEEQGRLFGLLEGGRGIASTLISFAALAVCAKLGEGKLGMQGTITFYAVVLMVLGVLCFFLMDKNPVEGKINAKECLIGMLQVLKLPKVWLAGLIVFCGYAAYQCLSFFTPYLVNVYGMSASMGSVISIIRTYILAIIIAPIGGAIAEAILERLLAKGCYGVITTHYANIKYYASNTEGIANGAMMFDVQNIRPLFRLETGKPGSSFAVEIARKIGLPEDIIRAAGEKAGSDHINIEKQLREIARDKHYWEQKRDRIRLTDRKVEELEQNYAEQLAKIRAERQEILKKAKQEAQRLIADANKQIENTIRTIREAQAEKELTRLARRELDDFRDAVAKADTADKDAEVAREIERIERRRQRREERKAQRGEAQAAGAAPAEAPKPREVEAGSKVRMAGQDMVGVVQSVKGRKAQVAFGQILTTVDRKMLTVVSNSEFREATRPQTARTVVSADISARKLSFKDHIDVRGMRAAEALDAVQDFIDDALMVGVGSVSILHGKGTGALKEEIRRYLRTVPEVESARDEHADRGGAGITIVTFDLS